MYDPPGPDNWYYTHRFDDSYKEAYDEGYNAAKDGLPEKANPHKESGHERDTTFSDELNYWWHIGHSNFHEGKV